MKVIAQMPADRRHLLLCVAELKDRTLSPAAKLVLAQLRYETHRFGTSKSPVRQLGHVVGISVGDTEDGRSVISPKRACSLSRRSEPSLPSSAQHATAKPSSEVAVAMSARLQIVQSSKSS